MTTARVLLVEDDDDFRELVGDALRLDGHEVVSVGDGGSALALVARAYAAGRGRAEYDIIITDDRLGVCSGLDLLEELRDAAWTTPAILMTAFTGGNLRSRAGAVGAVVFEKPLDADDLRTAVLHLLSRSRSS